VTIHLDVKDLDKQIRAKKNYGQKAISRTNNQIKENESRESDFFLGNSYQCRNEFFTAQIWNHVS